MIIDHLPGIRAFAEQRKLQLESRFTVDREAAARIDELNMIIVLCDGLEKQNELFSAAMNKGSVEA